MTLPNARHFDFSNPALRQQLGLRHDQANYPEIIPKQSHFLRQRRQYRSRAELTALVFDAVKNAPRPMSRRDIARALGVSKNNYLRDALAELVSLGRLVEHESDWHGIPMFEYEVV